VSVHSFETGEWAVADCLDHMRAMPSKSVDLVLGSPPYAEKGERYVDGGCGKMPTRDWVRWMMEVTREAVRVSRNVVVWVANGAVRGGSYFPACEGLVWQAFSEGIRCERPTIWHKNSAPSTRPWFGNDWEFCLAFRPDDSTEYFDWAAIGTPPKYKQGGKFRQRDVHGRRREGGSYPTSPVTRPRDVLRVTVGGGHLGSKLAHQCEAPFPELLVEPFVKACCPPGGVVLDPFGGSATTAAVAMMNGRRWIGIDSRPAMLELAGKRIEETIQRMGVEAAEAAETQQEGVPDVQQNNVV